MKKCVKACSCRASTNGMMPSNMRGRCLPAIINDYDAKLRLMIEIPKQIKEIGKYNHQNPSMTNKFSPLCLKCLVH